MNLYESPTQFSTAIHFSYYSKSNPVCKEFFSFFYSLNFNNEIQHPIQVSLDGFKNHIDTVFEKIDLCYSVHFSGGEPFLSKELHAMLRYLSDTYGKRIYDKFVIRNGTILPGRELLSRCVDSLLQQTYSDLEIILVDDGSTDDSGRVCDAYAKKNNRIQGIP